MKISMWLKYKPKLGIRTMDSFKGSTPKELTSYILRTTKSWLKIKAHIFLKFRYISYNGVGRVERRGCYYSYVFSIFPILFSFPVFHTFSIEPV